MKISKKDAEYTFLYQDGEWEDYVNKVVFVGNQKQALHFFKDKVKLLDPSNFSQIVDNDDSGNFLSWSNEDGMWATICQIKTTAKEKQGFVEGRIADLTRILGLAGDGHHTHQSKASVKCLNCKKDKLAHHSRTKGCPVGRKTRIGYTNFSSTQFFKSRKIK
jgi:hypothetical protein